MIIPVISAICYLIGGQWWKPARWFMGIAIWLLSSHWSFWFFIPYPDLGWNILAIPSYWIATSAFPYGDSSWLNIFGEWGKWGICGLVFGLASIPIIGIWGILQGIISSVSFVVLHYLDEKNIVKNPFQELLRGFMGCIIT